MPAERRGAITGATAGQLASLSTNNMSSGFTFGASTPAPAAPAFGAPAPAAPAPATGGFSFGGSTPAAAPAPTGGGLFGSTPAPAPAFGATPAPATAFGSTPAPATTFGAPAPATGGSLFGSTPAPAPGGSLFGSTPAPAPGAFGAPASGSLFGAPAPAPGGSLFGAPAPAPFGAPAPGAFGQVPAAVQGPPPALAGHMPYSSLPPDQKKAIDTLYQVMMQHKRTTLQVAAMSPKLLQTPQQPEAIVGSSTEEPLASQVQKLSTQVQHLHQELQTLSQNVDYTKGLYETSTTQAMMFAQWPTEAIATRRGVAIQKTKTAMDTETQAKLKELLDRQMAHVDRIEKMPSPYLWQTLDDMEKRLTNLKMQMESLVRNIESAKQIPTDGASILTIIRMQEQAIWKIATAMAIVHEQTDQLRHHYSLQEKGTNVIAAADQAEREKENLLEYKMREQMVKALPVGAPKPAAPAPGGLFGSAPSTGGLFGSTPAPAPGGSLFGSTPAPAAGGLFGSTPAPAPGGGLFGSTPAPAPGGGLFGSTPAPAPGGSLFGSTPAPAPGGGLFGSTPAPAPGAFGAAPAPAFGAPSPAPATGGFTFGGTPAPAPAGGAFGAAPTPAPASTFGAFGTSSSSSTPKSKNKGRSTRRR